MELKNKNTLLEIIRYRFNLDEDKANEEEIKGSLQRNVEFKGTNLWALIFAILIASIGLNVNSTAVIIGAMLISPLMGPIMGLGLGAGIFDFRLIKFSLKNLLVAVIISVLTSALYFWLTPLKGARSEILARTVPTIWDVLIALFGGLAGIIASSRKNLSNTIPGVAIATALMPPLCTAGYGLGTGNLYYFLGAFYLFLINSIFISISTFLIIRFLKFKPVGFVDKATEKRVRKLVWLIALFTILPSIYLAYKFVGQEIFKQNLKLFTHEVVEPRGFYIINERIRPGQRKVDWLVYGEEDIDTLKSVAKKFQPLYGLGEAEFTIKKATTGILESNKSQAMVAEEMGLTEKNAAILIEKDKTIRHLENRLSWEYVDTNTYNELRALFEPAELSIKRSILQSGQSRKDTVLLVYLKKKRTTNLRQVQRWLETKFYKDSIKLVVD
jgi:uncharacterized hydrophobic protein (TIGR00271 family)